MQLCVYRRSRQRVTIIGHSMGGLQGRSVAGRLAPRTSSLLWAAVSQRDGRPMRLHPRPVTAFGKRAIAQWASQSLEAGSTVRSDGLACFGAAEQAGCRHEPTVLGDSRRAVTAGRFNPVNTMNALRDLPYGLPQARRTISGRVRIAIQSPI